MKHQYESEILFHLMERDGFNIPSSVPPYEAEIKAYLINQVKLAYPKLTDYEAEWLLYNYTKHLPADFPISSATNVTKATFENVVPFAFQSAILKGKTLVNNIKRITATGGYTTIHNNGIGFTIDTNGQTLTSKITFSLSCINKITEGAKYTVIVDVAENTITRDNTSQMVLKIVLNNYDKVDSGFVKINIGETGLKVFEVIVPTSNTNIPYIETPKDIKGRLIVNGISIIEGHNHNLTGYIEDMQSVKMPVLTTKGKNLFNPNAEFNITDGIYGFIKLTNNKHNSIFVVEKDKTVDLSKIYFGLSGNGKNTDSGHKWLHQNGVLATDKIVDSEYGYFSFFPNNKTTLNKILQRYDIQFEESVTTTSYESYKSNSLTVNEEVELRGIGEVQDTLDCLTGEITQRIGVDVLDGNSTFSSVTTQQNGIRVQYNNANKKSGTNIPVISNKFNFVSYSNTNIPFTVFCGNNSDIYFMLPLNSNVTSVADAKKWFNENNTIIQYPLATESVKTVELKTVNESGESVHFMPLEGTMHVQSSGEPIQPTFDMSVPVEATTQNLASFIDLEMEE